MKTASNNNKQQETAKQMGDINNQKKNTESSRTFDIEQAFVAHMQQQQITECDVEGSNKYRFCTDPRLNQF